MSFDRMDKFSGAYPAGLPQRSLATPHFEGLGDLHLSGDQSIVDLSGQAIGPASAVSRGVGSEWAGKVVGWGSREIVADTLDRSKPFQQAQQSLSKKLGIKAKDTAATSTSSTSALPKTYSNLLHLGTEQVSLKNVNMSNFSQAVQNNLKPFKQAISSGNSDSFFKGVTPKSYLKDTVVKGNLQPVKDLASGSSNARLASNLVRSAAVGLMGYDVLKNTHDHYKAAKTQEDGSFKSKAATVAKTGTAFAKYAVRNVSTWEVAGVGMAVGKALIPLALGGVPLGGIAVGAMAGLAAQKCLDKVLKTGKKDPVQQEKAAKDLQKAKTKAKPATSGSFQTGQLA